MPDYSAFHRRMHELSVGFAGGVQGTGCANMAVNSAAGTAASTSGTAGTSATAGASTTCGSSKGVGGSTRRDRKGHSGAAAAGAPVAPCGSGFASCAESLLPATPPRSQFVFEVENPLAMHSPIDEQRQLQRRLSTLSALQQETIKLERKQRSEVTSMLPPAFTCPYLLLPAPTCSYLLLPAPTCSYLHRCLALPQLPPFTAAACTDASPYLPTQGRPAHMFYKLTPTPGAGPPVSSGAVGPIYRPPYVLDH